MENNTPKEDWISNVLTSTQGISRAQPLDGHFGRIMQRATKVGTSGGHEIPVIKWVAAAVILLALNLASVYYYSSTKQTAVASIGNENPISESIEASTTYNY